MNDWRCSCSVVNEAEAVNCTACGRQAWPHILYRRPLSPLASNGATTSTSASDSAAFGASINSGSTHGGAATSTSDSAASLSFGATHTGTWWQKRTGGGSDELKATEVCRRFRDSGKCKFGPHCSYAHVRTEKHPPRSIVHAARGKARKPPKAKEPSSTTTTGTHAAAQNGHQPTLDDNSDGMFSHDSTSFAGSLPDGRTSLPADVDMGENSISWAPAFQFTGDFSAGSPVAAAAGVCTTAGGEDKAVSDSVTVDTTAPTPNDSSVTTTVAAAAAVAAAEPNVEVDLGEELLDEDLMFKTLFMVIIGGNWDEQNFKDTSSCAWSWLALSSPFGVIFYATPDGLGCALVSEAVSFIESERSRHRKERAADDDDDQSDVAENESENSDGTVFHTLTSIKGPFTHLACNSDGSALAVVKGSRIEFYSTCDLVAAMATSGQDVKPLEVYQSQKELSAFAFHPTRQMCFAVLELGGGSICVGDYDYDAQPQKATTPPLRELPLCLAWSPNGEALICGNRQGSLELLTLSDTGCCLHLERSIPPAGDTLSHHMATFVHWVPCPSGSPNVWLVGYRPRDEESDEDKNQEALMALVQDHGEQRETKYTRFGAPYDLEEATGVYRFHVSFLADLRMAVVQSSKSASCYVYGQHPMQRHVSGQKWVMITPNEETTVSLPFTKEFDATFSRGVVIDTTNTCRVEWHEEQELQSPTPLLIYLTSHGRLCFVHMADKRTPNLPCMRPPAPLSSLQRPSYRSAHSMPPAGDVGGDSASGDSGRGFRFGDSTLTETKDNDSTEVVLPLATKDSDSANEPGLKQEHRQPGGAHEHQTPAAQEQQEEEEEDTEPEKSQEQKLASVLRKLDDGVWPTLTAKQMRDAQALESSFFDEELTAEDLCAVDPVLFTWRSTTGLYAGETALHIDSKASEARVLMALNASKVLQHPRVVNAIDNEARKHTPLMRAAAHGALELARSLVKHRADISALDSTGWSALDHSLLQKHLDVALFLLQQGARVCSLTIQFAQSCDDHIHHHFCEAYVMRELEVGRYPGVGAERSALRKVIVSGQGYDAFEEAFDYAFPEEFVTRSHASGGGATLLMEAIQFTPCSLQVVETLLTSPYVHHPTTLNTQDSSTGQTALHLAVAGDLPQVVRMLLAYGADVGVQDNDGNTALMLQSLFAGDQSCRHLIEQAESVGVAAAMDSLCELRSWLSEQPQLTDEWLLAQLPARERLVISSLQTGLCSWHVAPLPTLQCREELEACLQQYKDTQRRMVALVTRKDVDGDAKDDDVSSGRDAFLKTREELLSKGMAFVRQLEAHHLLQIDSQTATAAAAAAPDPAGECKDAVVGSDVALQHMEAIVRAIQQLFAQPTVEESDTETKGGDGTQHSETSAVSTPYTVVPPSFPWLEPQPSFPSLPGAAYTIHYQWAPVEEPVEEVELNTHVTGTDNTAAPSTVVSDGGFNFHFPHSTGFGGFSYDPFHLGQQRAAVEKQSVTQKKTVACTRKIFACTASPALANHSFEELRWCDLEWQNAAWGDLPAAAPYQNAAANVSPLRFDSSGGSAMWKFGAVAPGEAVATTHTPDTNKGGLAVIREVEEKQQTEPERVQTPTLEQKGVDNPSSGDVAQTTPEYCDSSLSLQDLGEMCLSVFRDWTEECRKAVQEVEETRTAASHKLADLLQDRCCSILRTGMNMQNDPVDRATLRLEISQASTKLLRAIRLERREREQDFACLFESARLHEILQQLRTCSEHTLAALTSALKLYRRAKSVTEAIAVIKDESLLEEACKIHSTYVHQLKDLKKRYLYAKVEMEMADGDDRTPARDGYKKAIRAYQRLSREYEHHIEKLAQSMFHAPHLLLEGPAEHMQAISLNLSSDGLMCDAVKFEYFDDCVPLPGTHRHRIFKCVFDEETYVLKEFTKVDNLLAQAKRLRALKHPHVVQLLRVVESQDNRMFLQMPYYAEGTLASYISTHPERSATDVRLLMRQVVSGLVHIHHHQVVHCDIKPSNIFLSSCDNHSDSKADDSVAASATTLSLHVRIGDFDVSKDDVERAATVTVTNVVGFTEDYVAPEVVRSEPATFKSDMYSLGLLLFDLAIPVSSPAYQARPVAREQKPLDEEVLKQSDDVPPQLRNLLSRLLATEPQNRPDAPTVLSHEYFVMADMQLRDTERKERERQGQRVSCIVCGDDVTESQGLYCPQRRHFMCNQCFADCVTAQSGDGLESRQGQILCPEYVNKSQPCQSSAGGYAGVTIAVHAGPQAFDVYMKAQLDLVAKRKDHEAKERLQTELQQLLQMNERQRKVQLARTNIIDNVLTDRCPYPNCRAAFFDKEGCMAIQCSTCKKYFCGWCLACRAQSRAAHDHVRACPYNLSPNGVFNTLEEWTLGCRLRRVRKLNVFLPALKDDDVAREVLQSLSQELADLHIDTKELYPHVRPVRSAQGE